MAAGTVLSRCFASVGGQCLGSQLTVVCTAPTTTEVAHDEGHFLLVSHSVSQVKINCIILVLFCDGLAGPSPESDGG